MKIVKAFTNFVD